MRILIDACVDPRVATLLADHAVSTLRDLGWQHLTDDVLIERIQGLFDVFLTADKGFEHEHNLRKLRFGIVIAHVPKNKVEFQDAIARVRPGEVEHARGSSLPENPC
ncbi:MAG TPA: DUF5615 family PIN-like protein [Candidatus Acidoferrales bacterium]|nr:DUF5615 family PIN-like protein [Candidatus Acidoferrales bacterium]